MVITIQIMMKMIAVDNYNNKKNNNNNNNNNHDNKNYNNGWVDE